ncbi:TIGR04282 family arsenosugar biosynthesis glycosyltransferase [Rapidithrix thailandica]|uniref:TIGR04282 family arsenosugar biosynthesis glycosyltransferase n=1 Tax=Rapidithrix thailandica TaxID=413964 RepID=A0AAW9S2M3_9BACT
MCNSYLIVFVKNLEKGKVKTRLGKVVGDENALLVYQKLLKHTADQTQQLMCKKVVFYSESIEKKDLWLEGVYTKALQVGKTLGERMKNAFAFCFEQGADRVMVIGSDCPELSQSIIEEAFDRLESYDTVIGPAADGGYYLLGLNKPVPELFENIQWSTSSVLKDSLNILHKKNLSNYQLPVLSDLDTVEDLKRYADYYQLVKKK